jgi:hypothetical protein
MIPAPGFSFFFFLVYCLLEQIMSGESHPTQVFLSAALEAEKPFFLTLLLVLADSGQCTTQKCSHWTETIQK